MAKKQNKATSKKQETAAAKKDERLKAYSGKAEAEMKAKPQPKAEAKPASGAKRTIKAAVIEVFAANHGATQRRAHRRREGRVPAVGIRRQARLVVPRAAEEREAHRDQSSHPAQGEGGSRGRSRELSRQRPDSWTA
jgi:hypothetical protein